MFPYTEILFKPGSRWSYSNPAVFDANTGITVSNGGLNAPFTDFVKYLDFLTGNPAKQATYDRILKRSSLEEMSRAAYVVGFNTNGPHTEPLDARIKEYLFRNIFPLFGKAD